MTFPLLSLISKSELGTLAVTEALICRLTSEPVLLIRGRTASWIPAVILEKSTETKFPLLRKRDFAIGICSETLMFAIRLSSVSTLGRRGPVLSHSELRLEVGC